MSNAEKILNEIIPHNEYRANGNGRWLHDDKNCPRCDFEDRFIEAMQAHTNQTLSDLKEQLESKYQNDESRAVCRGYDIALDDIIYLIEKKIDEAINE